MINQAPLIEFGSEHGSNEFVEVDADSSTSSKKTLREELGEVEEVRLVHLEASPFQLPVVEESAHSREECSSGQSEEWDAYET